MVACPNAAHTCKALPMRSSLSGHSDSAASGRRLKGAVVALGLLKIAQRKFSDGIRERVSGAAIT